ncbi:DUF1326 domain-containing protein [Spartinivicinus poritis]|uniref:DUF1326 domain-containing protein n=1 Tax=Spartinivicinus poritis TaxID=2994640 RepID=A0ABT5UBW9_9GAMM|nr:DUF1326 domain-containing protein [Spartinivicinus sp. A2-2]MDE1463883.1 DUF1326 domain-containing protein [Spartinivicinus sp. A2-2]
MGYKLEGKLLEVCDCNILCPCWVGEDPDGETCNTIIAWHMDKGDINGIDVTGLTIAVTAHIPGNIMEGNWRVVMYVDGNASKAQEEALLQVYTGELGGPVADLVQLVGEVVAVERANIEFAVHDGKGTIRIGSDISAELQPFEGPTGKSTLSDTVFSTVPGAPAYVGKASDYKMKQPLLGLDIDMQGHNAIQGQFLFEA